MEPFIVIAEVTARLTNESQVEKALLDLAEKTRGETGCIEYQLCRELSEDVRWVIYEVWKTEQDWCSHLKVDHLHEFKDILGAIGGTLTARKFASLAHP